jgi:hypothetical protein
MGIFTVQNEPDFEQDTVVMSSLIAVFKGDPLARW